MGAKTVEGPRILTRDDILGTSLRRETVEVPEWGGSVIVRCLTGAERDEYDSWRFNALVATNGSRPSLRNVRARLAALSIVNEQGERQFSDDDVLALGEKDGAALHRVFEVAQRLSQIVSEREMEALIANLKAGPTAARG